MKQKEDLKEMREQFMKVLNVDVNMFPEMEPVVDWMDGLIDRLRKACAAAMSEWPEGEKGPGEALMLGLARFNCMVMEKFQRAGFVNDGKDAYDMFVEVLMPTCHALVKKEADDAEKQHDEEVEETDETTMSIAKKLADPDVPIEDIVKEFFRDDMTDEKRESVTNELREIRRKHLEKQEKKEDE